MSKILLAIGAVVFAGVVATVASAADHKSKPAAAPARSAMVAAKEDAKGPAHKHRHASKKAHHAHKAAPHHAK